MADPLSGPVIGGKDAEAVRVRVVEPSKPDIEAVREAMTSVLDEDSELMLVLPPITGPDNGSAINGGGTGSWVPSWFQLAMSPTP
jgi:hypothetical protein